jgi:hypothetical protein
MNRSTTIGAVLILAAGACERKAADSEPREQAETPAATPETPAAAETEKETVPTAAEAEPSTKAASKQGFEGRVQMRVAGDKPAEVEYAVKGDRVRVGIRKSPAGTGDVDAIIDKSDKTVTLMLDDQKKYATIDLDDVIEKARKKAAEVELRKTGQTQNIAGLECEMWELTDQKRKVSACVVHGPAWFDPTALEQFANIELPAWAEHVIRAGYFPLQVTVTDAAGKKSTAFETTRWSEGKVEEGDLEVPEGFEKVDRKDLQKLQKGARQRLP